MATPKPTRPNLWAQPERDDDGWPTGRVHIFTITEEQRTLGADGWEARWATRTPLMTVGAEVAATIVGNLGRAMSAALQPKPEG